MDDSKYRTFCYECDKHHDGDCDESNNEAAYDEYDMWREAQMDMLDDE